MYFSLYIHIYIYIYIYIVRAELGSASRGDVEATHARRRADAQRMNGTAICHTKNCQTKNL